MTDEIEDARPRHLRLPRPLASLIFKFTHASHDPELQREVVNALRSLSDTARWQTAWIEQLEDALATHSITVKPKCFNCQSLNIETQFRAKQRRHTCLDCGYAWRLGMRDQT